METHHSQANILISDDHHALLADFGLINVAFDSGATCADTSALVGGTVRWMSPELLHPENFGLSNSNPTKPSDVYALGMVIFEASLFLVRFLTT
jgi:serine/threonine protein kinase